MKRPRILYITPCWPHAKSFGSQMRVLQIARALQRHGDLSLAVTTFPGTEEEGVQKSKDEFEVVCCGKVKHAADRSFLSRLSRAMNPRCANPDGHLVEQQVRDQVLERLADFDLIWISALRTANAFQRWGWKASVMDIDDVPSTYQRTLWQNGSSWLERFNARRRMLICRKREGLLRERFSVLAVCSEADRDYLKPLTPIHVIPNGFEQIPAQAARKPAHPPRLGFIGQFNYAPNSEGVRWFAERCWPIVKRAEPEVRLRLVGNGTDGPSKPAGPDIDGIGWVADPTAETESWAAMIVPVFIGAGTRVKVAEAFSRRCPLVSTPLGVFGYGVKHENEVLLAESPQDFAAACLRIIRNPVDSQQMAERAWNRFIQEWTWEAIQPRIIRAADDCLNRTKT